MYNVGKDIPNKDLALTLGLAMYHDFQNSKLHLSGNLRLQNNSSISWPHGWVDGGLGAVGLL